MAESIVPAPLVLFGAVIVTMILAWAYFCRYTMARPPIGVMNRSDVAILLILTVAFTFLDVIIPGWMTVALVGLGALSALYVTLEPVAQSSRARWAIVFIVLALEIAGRIWLAPNPSARYAVNDVVVALAAAGVANLWAQSGLKAGDAALFGAGLAIYDDVTTVHLPVTADLFARLIGEPFAPILAWATDAGGWLGLGLGDLLVATLFVLVMGKAYGRIAAAFAFGGNLVAVGALLAPTGIVDPHYSFPVMVVVGPLMILQYGDWRWRRGRERTTYAYRRRAGDDSPSAAESYLPGLPPTYPSGTNGRVSC